MEVEADVVDGGEARAVVLAESAAAAAVDLAEVADREDRRRALGGASRRGGSICARGGRSWRAGGGCRGAWKTASTAPISTIRPWHDRDLVGDLGDDAHVVGDEQHRHVVRDLQALDEIEDRGLGRDVERGRRLVGDQDVGLQARAMAMQTRWRMPPEYSKE
jgi:hypothetical protein